MLLYIGIYFTPFSFFSADSEVSNDSGIETTVGWSLPPDYMDLDEFLVATGVKLDVAKSAFQSRVVPKRLELTEQAPKIVLKSIKATEEERNKNNADDKESMDTLSEAKNENTKTSSGKTTKRSAVNKDGQDYNYSYNPLPMKRKAQRQFVQDTEKDDKYWKRRNRNNEAARRSRDMRRQREIEISLQCKELEKENARLKKELQKLKDKANKLEKQLLEK